MFKLHLSEDVYILLLSFSKVSSLHMSYMCIFQQPQFLH